MEFAETGFVDHEQAPPHQRTHSAAHYAKLINRKGRYGSRSGRKPRRTPVRSES